MDKTITEVKPNCYDCVHRRSSAGTGHSNCAHPGTKKLQENNGLQAMVILASAANCDIGVMPLEDGLVVEGNPHGRDNGWFNYPLDFDPTWLVSCNGFSPRDKEKS